ncbi:MAG: PaaI family thioesterase [Candidatus Dormibacteraceae bacterium]
MEIGTPPPAWSSLGLVADRFGEGAVVEMEGTPGMRGGSGHLDPGFVSALADSAMELAVDSALGPRSRASIFDLKLSFVAPAEVGARLRAVATVIHLGRRTAFAECRVEGTGGGVIATATGTFQVRAPVEDPHAD